MKTPNRPGEKMGTRFPASRALRSSAAPPEPKLLYLYGINQAELSQIKFAAADFARADGKRFRPGEKDCSLNVTRGRVK